MKKPETEPTSKMVYFSEYKLTRLIKWLNAIPSVTDFETLYLNMIEEAAEWNDLRTQRVAGQLVIGRAETLFRIVAHADRIGFVLTTSQRIEELKDVELCYAPGTKIDPKLLNKRFADSFLEAFNPNTGKKLFWCFMTPGKEDKIIAKVIHIPENSMSEVSQTIPLTAVGPYIRRYEQYLVGSFDNSVGVALALKLVSEMPQVFSCVLTTGEEGPGYAELDQRGCRGARKYIRHHDLSQILVILDVRPSTILGNETRVGKGVVLRTNEERETAEGRIRVISAMPEILNYLQNYAVRNTIPFQTYEGLGITEAGRAQEELGSNKLKCVWLQPPVGSNHTPNEIVSINDIMNTFSLARSLAHYNQ